MGRYIRKVRQIGSIGPNEERGAGLWAGYDLLGVDDDLSHHGLINVEGWPEARIAEHGVTTFLRVAPDDVATYARLGLETRK